jgi:[glutamine synthetase] adenylyltransferase / [glutamine synthetase]-adenylyl-L-tyrosine phosphorylase
METLSRPGHSDSGPREFAHVIRAATGHSHYFRRMLESDPALQAWLQEHFSTPCTGPEMAAWLDASPAADERELARVLRQLRRKVMLKLIARDLSGLADLDEVMSAMTALAELCIQRAQALLMTTLGEQFGTPVGESSGAAQALLVVGMGKLGGGELNASSDIDLIFVYPEDGETDGPRRLSNHEFFTRLGRRLITALADITGDGFVFRVDMRLRPYGDSGPLVMSFAALEEYLVAQGREWERYAWIKARVVSPARHPAAAELDALAQPFVFRKYLDFGAFDSMRKLHAQIRAEVARRDRFQNIKLGPGGIREIEFIAQVFQLIRGGREARLRIRPTRSVLALLAQTGELDPQSAARLDEAYVFLRNLEHRLQYLEDQQTQELPDAPETQALVASAMGYADYAALLAVLDPMRRFVSAQFDAVFGARAGDESEEWWHDEITPDEIEAALSGLNFPNRGATAERLLQFRNGGRYRAMPAASRARIARLVPRFAALCAVTANADAALARVVSLLEAIGRRASYLAFLAEYPQVLPRLTHLLASSAWAAEYLERHPILLDELLDAREIYQSPDWGALDRGLGETLAECGTDVERQMDALRQFQHAQTFQLLAMDLQGLLPLEKLSDHLSDLADMILRHVVALCWKGLPARHRETPAFAVISYGKLGGRELGYASDLDLIFLYDDDTPDAGVAYANLGKRINAMLSSYTAAGRLYEVDLRLRPNGESGLLVSSVAAFSEYQLRHAWTWEHQALTRARFCAGDAGIGEWFESFRIEVLRLPRDAGALRGEIAAMRQKMRDGHPNRSGLFDIKHDPGGMVDIEFIVQYLVLAHAHAHAGLTANSGNLALLRLAGEIGLVDAALAAKVCEIYRGLRAIQHRMRLNSEEPCRVPPGEVDVGPVRELWDGLLGSPGQ